MSGLAHNEDGKVFCHLCEWWKDCRSMEEIEFSVQKHMTEDHNVTVTGRVENDTGKRHDIPQYKRSGSMDDKLDRAGTHPAVDIRADARRKARFFMNCAGFVLGMAVLCLAVASYHHGGSPWAIISAVFAIFSMLFSGAATLHLMRRTK